MFKSKTRSINVPQYEHGKLAGTLAAHWGNEQFDQPSFDFRAFVSGVALHDWGYGILDNIPIMEAAEEDWLVVAKRGIELKLENPIAEIVQKMHVRRLLSNHDTPERKVLIEEISRIIEETRTKVPISQEEFDWADRITRFCDDIAFVFSFDRPTTFSRTVFDKVGRFDSTQELTCTIKPGEIIVDPWPFSVPSFDGIMIGYQRDGYPERLNPILIPYIIHQPTQ